MLVNWAVGTKYTDATPWGGNGATEPTSKTAAAPAIGSSTSELTVLSLASGMTADSIVHFDVTAAVQDWATTPVNNKGLNIQAAATSDGWDVNFPGSANVTLRPKLIIRYTPPASTEPASNTVDLANGMLAFNGGAGLSNALSVSLSSGGTPAYTFTDTSGNISLTQAAKDAGWTGDGTTSVTGPASSVTGSIAISTGTGSDTIAINGLANELVLDAGGDAGDAVTFGGVLNASGKNLTILGAENITATPGSLVNLGTGTLTLNASNGVGTSTNPIATQVGRLSLKAGDGGAFVNEADGAVVVADISGAGSLTVTNATGTLTANANETIRTASGSITLSSGDGIALNGVVGITALTGGGTITLAANTDGNGTQGYSQGLRGLIATTGDVSITANTSSGGTGDVILGNTGIGGTLTVSSNAGNILWNSSLPLSAITAGTSQDGLTATNYVLTATGPTSSIGTAARPIQTQNNATADALNKSKAMLMAGNGGIFLTDWDPLDLTISQAIATGAGKIQIIAANAGSHNLFIDGPVSTGSGSISLSSDDDMTLTSNAAIGGAGFSGTVTLTGNVDAGNEQRITMNAGSSIVTSNNSANAVLLTIKATDTNAANATIGGITLGNITVGDGGTITALINSTGTDSITGNITQTVGTSLNASSGKVVLSCEPCCKPTASLPP